MAQPEQILAPIFTELALTGKTKATAHRRRKYRMPPDNPQTSHNWGPLEAGCNILDSGLAGQQWATNQFFNGFEAACVERPIPGLRSVGFMGNEGTSLIYFLLHFLSWLAAWVTFRTGQSYTWLRFALAMLETCATPEGRCGLVGQRSARPGIDAVGFHDFVLSVSRGVFDNWPLNKRGKRIPQGNLPWEYRVLLKWDEYVYDIGKFVGRGTEAFATLQGSPLRLRTEYRWAHRPNGEFVAMWIDSRETKADVHASTFPVLARVRLEDGSLVTLPRGGGEKHQRGSKKHGSDEATCTFDPETRTLHYTARRTTPSPDSITLPPGPLVLRSSRNNYQPEVIS